MTSLNASSRARRPPDAWTRLSRAALLWGFAVTLMRALRAPNDWAMAHWLISYQFGPLKRALPGTLLHPLLATPFGSAHTEQIIVVVCSMILALFCVVYLRLVFSVLGDSGWSAESVLLGAALATSPVVVMAGHVNGYFDEAFFLLTWWAIHLVFLDRRWAGALALSAALLMHESVFVIGVPLALLAIWLSTPRETDGARARAGSLMPPLRRMLPLLLPVAVFGALVLHQRSIQNPIATREALTEYLARFSFIGHDRDKRVPKALTTAFGDYVQTQGPRFWLRFLRRRYCVEILPGVALCLAFAARWLRGQRSRAWVMAAGTVTSLIPLSLLAIALDTSRIWTYTLVTATTFVWIVSRTFHAPEPRARDSALFRWACVAVVGINMLTTVELMDLAVERYSAGMRMLLYVPVVAFVIFVLLARRAPTDAAPTA